MKKKKKNIKIKNGEKSSFREHSFTRIGGTFE